jgi:hypothetical protein
MGREKLPRLIGGTGIIYGNSHPMKLSAIFMSINIAATVPVAAYASGQAEDGTVKSSSADWLKSSIADTGTTKAATLRKFSLSDSDTPRLPKLRAFDPNRKLPHKKDLEASLMAQTPQMAQDPSSPLSGEVSGNFAPTSSPYASSLGSQNASSSQFLDRQSHSTKSSAHTAAKKSPMQMANEWIAGRNKTANNPTPDSEPIDNTPVIAQDESVLRLLDPANLPHGNSSDATIALEQNMAKLDASNIGPPPFPLNLLPEDSLKQLVANPSARAKIDAPKAYFGSWRQGSHALSPAGFHTYMHSNSPQVATYGQYAPRTYLAYAPAKSGPTNSTRTSARSTKNNKHNAQTAHQKSSSQPINVAVYPSYSSPWSTITY